MAMATILVSEADPDVRRLLVVLIERLGHEAVVLDPDVVVPPRADLLLVEPESAVCLEHARLVRAYFPDLPVLCMNALPDGRRASSREARSGTSRSRSRSSHADDGSGRPRHVPRLGETPYGGLRIASADSGSML